MATYYNKNLIDGISELPRMTQAEFDELSLDEKPINWICRNYTGTQRGIKSSDVEHSTGVSVKDKIDSMDTVEFKSYPLSIDGGSYPINIKKSGHIVELWFWCDKSISSDTLVTLDERFRPNLSNYPYALYVMEELTGDSRLTLASTGAISITEASTNKWRFFHTSWIV